MNIRRRRELCADLAEVAIRLDFHPIESDLLHHAALEQVYL